MDSCRWKNQFDEHGNSAPEASRRRAIRRQVCHISRSVFFRQTEPLEPRESNAVSHALERLFQIYFFPEYQWASDAEPKSSG